jgi:uncharacterized protein YndB with AHSA1/START domain/DNA-binding transcriptional ArsR family regulator
MDNEHVFKALADRNRRLLLDLLHQQDGRTLTELAGHLDHMTRFGVAKHLGILEEAGLITTRKVGREKHHYLNPVPIQQVYERWVSKYAQPWAKTMTALKSTLEEQTMSDIPAHVYHIFIQTTPEKLWQALTDGTITPQYYFGTEVKSTWESDADYSYHYADGGDAMVKGTIVEIDPPRKLVQTFIPAWYDKADADNPSTVIWEIEPMGDACRLTLTHLNLDPATAPAEGIKQGWSQILSGLKTLLETGKPLDVGQPEAEGTGV